MSRKPSPPANDVIACEVCLKEIPRDLAKSEEAAEIVHHFCGLDCYARWQQEGGHDRDGKTRKP